MSKYEDTSMNTRALTQMLYKSMVKWPGLDSVAEEQRVKLNFSKANKEWP